MPSIPELFALMPSRFQTGVLAKEKTYYFSLGDHKYTAFLGPTGCRVETGKAVENADVVLKATPELFLAMVTQGKMPSAWDIAKGAIKTNDVSGLADLGKLFRFS